MGKLKLNLMVKLEQSGVLGHGRRIKRFAGLNLTWRIFVFLTTLLLHQKKSSNR